MCSGLGDDMVHADQKSIKGTAAFCNTQSLTPTPAQSVPSSAFKHFVADPSASGSRAALLVGSSLLEWISLKANVIAGGSILHRDRMLGRRSRWHLSARPVAEKSTSRRICMCPQRMCSFCDSPTTFYRANFPFSVPRTVTPLAPSSLLRSELCRIRMEVHLRSVHAAAHVYITKTKADQLRSLSSTERSRTCLGRDYVYPMQRGANGGEDSNEGCIRDRQSFFRSSRLHHGFLSEFI